MHGFRLSNGSTGERNICFINCILQLLFSVPILRHYFNNYSVPTQSAERLRRRRSPTIANEISRIFSKAGSNDIVSAKNLRIEVGAFQGIIS